MSISHSQVSNRTIKARKLNLRGTPISINRRILEHLYKDLQEKRITALLLVEISRDMRKALYGKEVVSYWKNYFKE